MQVKSTSFREQRKKSWKKLEFYLNKVDDKGIKSLTPKEITHLTQLYRITCSSLHVARNISLDKNLHEYLENLVTQGYLTLYCTKPVRQKTIRRFFLKQFPRLVRKYIWFHLVAFLITFFGVILAYNVTANNPESYFVFVQRSMAQGRTPYSSRKELKKVLVSGRKLKGAQKSYFASQLFTHNTQVGFLCFASGILLGLPAIYLLFYNGTTLGAMSYVYHSHNLSSSWWAWILAHGITELLAIILCGGAGLMIGTAIIAPGKYGRKVHLKAVGQEAGLIVMGTMVLFFVAGILEGHFRQSSASNGIRFLVALSTLVFWSFYFSFQGKQYTNK